MPRTTTRHQSTTAPREPSAPSPNIGYRHLLCGNPPSHEPLMLCRVNGNSINACRRWMSAAGRARTGYIHLVSERPRKRPCLSAMGGLMTELLNSARASASARHNGARLVFPNRRPV